jgi:hypothetical protein
MMDLLGKSDDDVCCLYLRMRSVNVEPQCFANEILEFILQHSNICFHLAIGSTVPLAICFKFSAINMKTNVAAGVIAAAMVLV